MKIAIAGIGYVGLSNAILLAQHNSVTLVDIDKERVDLLNAGKSPLMDNEIEKYLAKVPLCLVATTDGNRAYQDADFVIISTPTDYDPVKNHFDTSAVESVIHQVIAVNTTAVIVIRSTVPIGYTCAIRERLGYDRIIFSPEFLREGHALYDNLYPSRIIVGVQLNDSDLKQSAHIFSRLLSEGAMKQDVPIQLLNPTEAEAVKLFANTYLAMRIAFFNELDTYAEIQGLDTRQIIEGIGYDPRIGNYYNNPSFGYGGYCLPKDTRQLDSNFANVPSSLIKSIVDSNRLRKDFIAERISEKANCKSSLIKRPCVIGIYRLIMKTDSDNFRQSSILDVMKRLQEKGMEIIVFEPALEERYFLGSMVMRDWAEFIKRSDLIIANRIDQRLFSISDRVYTRDIYFRD